MQDPLGVRSVFPSAARGEEGLLFPYDRLYCCQKANIVPGPNFRIPQVLSQAHARNPLDTRHQKQETKSAKKEEKRQGHSAGSAERKCTLAQGPGAREKSSPPHTHHLKEEFRPVTCPFLWSNRGEPGRHLWGRPSESTPEAGGCSSPSALCSQEGLQRAAPPPLQAAGSGILVGLGFLSEHPAKPPLQYSRSVPS
uniref:Uncharacterized protein n=1 Tax=Sphaerodactylus townsendi TaxID=933632 RepID=A0ACB8EQ15_9SAUR